MDANPVRTLSEYATEQNGIAGIPFDSELFELNLFELLSLPQLCFG
jgi:hypothetical protein